jgi:integrase
MMAAGLAASSVHRHYRTLRRMLQVAVEKERLLSNPCDRVEPPRVLNREMVFLTWEEAVALAEAHGERYRAFIYLAVDSGMRWSELVGLRRARVDLHNRKVRATEQLVRLGTGDWLRKEPKTRSSIRSITISPVTSELLADHVNTFANSGPDGLVFPNKAGNPLISCSWWNNNFAPALRKTGLSCRFHDLRHTSVALAIAEGAHPKAIQTCMGHSSIRVTLDRYGHLFPELVR